jgi:tetratricopeptide (TPR) repeat protein
VTQSNNLVLQEINRAIRLAEKGKKNDALAIYGQIADKIPDDQETRGQFVQLCLILGNAKFAIELLKELIHDFPGNAFHMGMLGNAHMQVNELSQAIDAFQRSIEIDPNLWMVHAYLGATYGKLEQFEKAIEPLERVVALKPSHADSLSNLSVCLTKIGRHEEALAYGKKAIRLDPQNPGYYDDVGCVLTELGQLSEATACFEKAIAFDNTYNNAYLNISKIKKFSEEDASFISSIERQLKRSIPAQERANFHFVLGKIYDDLGEYSKAFKNFHQGNLLAKTRRREPTEFRYALKLLRKVFTKERLSMAPALGNPTDLPIFIVGMPRSGTTLIEQIISRHSSVTGAGELETIHEIANKICHPVDSKNYVNKWLKHLNHADLNEDAKSYLNVLRKGKEESLRITDKLPENYLYLGFIHLLFPNAKIIHAVRNPLDTCLSCYFQTFPHLHWVYDMEWIVERYRLYRQVMDYWESVFPPDTILDVNYESLVENQEAESRRLIAHCGLDWEERCLDFKSEKRVVATASQWQVRQPLYKSSVKRWKNYAPHLAALANSLSEYLGNDDIESLRQVGIKVRSKRWWF